MDLRDCNTSQADVLLLANWLHVPAVKTAVKAIYFETTGDKKEIKFKRRSSIALTFFQSSLKISNRRLGCHDAQVLAAWLEIHQTSVNTLDISGDDMLDLQGATALSRAIKAQRVLYRPITLYSEKKSNRKFKSLLAGTLQSHRAQLILSLGGVDADRRRDSMRGQDHASVNHQRYTRESTDAECQRMRGVGTAG